MSPNVPISNDPKGLATDLPAGLGDLIPRLKMLEFSSPIYQLTRERDDFRNDELRHRTRVSKRGIEDDDSTLGRRDKVNLICADTEAANRLKLLMFSGDSLKRI